MSREIKMTGGGAVIVVIVFIILALVLLFSAIVIGLIGAMYFNAPFEEGWNMAWERWGWTLFFGLFIFGGFRASK